MAPARVACTYSIYSIYSPYYILHIVRDHVIIVSRGKVITVIILNVTPYIQNWTELNRTVLYCAFIVETAKWWVKKMKKMKNASVWILRILISLVPPAQGPACVDENNNTKIHFLFYEEKHCSKVLLFLPYYSCFFYYIQNWKLVWITYSSIKKWYH